MKYKITALLIEVIQPLLTISYPCLCIAGRNFISISIKVLKMTSRHDCLEVFLMKIKEEINSSITSQAYSLYTLLNL